MTSLQYKFWVSLVLWKHNNGEDCWLGNGPEDDHWHPPQRVQVTEGHYWKGGGGCSRSAVSKHIKCKVDWKELLGWENMHEQQWWLQAWEYCQAKPIQTLGRASQGVNWSWIQCIKSHHAQTSSGKELHFWNRNIIRSILPGLRRKRTGLLLSGPKSSFQMKVNFAFHLEIKVPESRGRVERHRIHVAWSPCDDLGCCDVCWCWSVVFSEVHSQCSHLPGDFGALYASVCFMEMLI